MISLLAISTGFVRSLAAFHFPLFFYLSAIGAASKNDCFFHIPHRKHQDSVVQEALKKKTTIGKKKKALSSSRRACSLDDSEMVLYFFCIVVVHSSYLNISDASYHSKDRFRGSLNLFFFFFCLYQKGFFASLMVVKKKRRENCTSRLSLPLALRTMLRPTNPLF